MAGYLVLGTRTQKSGILPFFCLVDLGLRLERRQRNKSGDLMKNIGENVVKMVKPGARTGEGGSDKMG